MYQDATCIREEKMKLLPVFCKMWIASEKNSLGTTKLDFLKFWSNVSDMGDWDQGIVRMHDREKMFCLSAHILVTRYKLWIFCPRPSGGSHADDCNLVDQQLCFSDTK